MKYEVRHIYKLEYTTEVEAPADWTDEQILDRANHARKPSTPTQDLVATGITRIDSSTR